MADSDVAHTESPAGRHHRRVALVGMLAGSAMHVATIVVGGTDPWRFGALVAAWVVASAGNAAAASAHGRGSATAIEVARMVLNSAVAVFTGIILAFGPVYWMWLPFFAGMQVGTRVGRPGVAVALSTAVVVPVGLIGGGSPWHAITAVLSAAFVYWLGHVHVLFSEELLAERDAHIRELDAARRRLAEQAAALDVSNSQLTGRFDQLERAQRDLVDASRRAGMAEVATSVLHNVGNVLNSINVGLDVVVSTVRESQVLKLERGLGILREQPDPAAFFATDPRGHALARFLAAASAAALDEREQLLEELHGVRGRMEHINLIVSRQQAHATTVGVTEPIRVASVISDVLLLNESRARRHGVTVRTVVGAHLEVLADRARVFQIVANLVGNAIDAVKARPTDRTVTVTARRVGRDRLSLDVTDNGEGIAPEDRDRVFTYGFTTKVDGHGFGLHSSACHAREMGGSLTASSEGRGLGATFVLELPVQPASTSTPAVAASA